MIDKVNDSPADQPAVEVTGLSKRYGEFVAVDGISFAVRSGEIFGFLGPNGAGKSTTIKMLCTLVHPSAGTARVAGFDVATERMEVRRRIGLVFQDPTLDSYLTAEQNLRFHAELYGMPAEQVEPRIAEVLEMVQLTDRRTAKVLNFSGGMRRRLEIARGLMHSPEVLFLDEPTVGLDPQTRAGIWEYITELRQRTRITVFLTTHYMDEAEHCDRIAILDHGHIVALDTPDELKAGVGKDTVQLDTDDDAAAERALTERFGLSAARRGGQLSIQVPSGHLFVPRLFSELGVPIRSVQVARPTLDDVFMAHTGRTIRDAEATATDGNRMMINAMRRNS